MPDKETVYCNAVEFIEITEKLKGAPAILNEKCGRLEELRKELRDSIDALKQQSEQTQAHLDHSTSS